jgi:hypothetical protein
MRARPYVGPLPIFAGGGIHQLSDSRMADG